jgi:hypothetical protein
VLGGVSSRPYLVTSVASMEGSDGAEADKGLTSSLKCFNCPPSPSHTSPEDLDTNLHIAILSLSKLLSPSHEIRTTWSPTLRVTIPGSPTWSLTMRWLWMDQDQGQLHTNITAKDYQMNLPSSLFPSLPQISSPRMS